MKKILFERVAKDLIGIIDETPLALRPSIIIPKNKIEAYFVMGFTMNTPWGGKGIALAYECDNMTKTLVHEALHIQYPILEETDIEGLTEEFFNIMDVRKASQRRIVDKLNEYEKNRKMKKYEMDWEKVYI